MDFAKKKIRKVKKDSKLAALLFKTGVVIVAGLALYIFLITRPVEGRYNILLVGKDLLLVSLEKDQSQATVVLIPQNTMLSSSYGKGSVLAGSLYKLDNVSKQNGKLVTSTIREFLGTPVDGWVLIDKNSNISNKDSFLQVLNTNLSFKSNIIPQYKSSFSLISAPRFYYSLSSIRPDRIKFIDLNNSISLVSTTLADGSNTLGVDTVGLDSFLNEIFYQWSIRKEGFSIAVLNGSDVPGLATRASRIVSNSGGNVIQLMESPTKVVGCIIYTPSGFEKTYTLRKLKQVFECDVINEKIEGNRADIALVVGNAYSKQITDSNHN